MKLAKSIAIIALFSALLLAQDSVKVSFDSKATGVTFETAPTRAAISQKTATDLIAQGCVELGVLTVTTPELKQDLTPAILTDAEGRQGDTVILHESVNASQTAYKQKCADQRIVDGPGAWQNGQFKPTRVLECYRYEDDVSKPYTVYVKKTSAQIFRCSYDRARYAELHARLLKEKAVADRVLGAINERIQRDPKSGEALRQRAEFYKSHNDYQSAIQDYSKAIELNASDIAAWKGRGEVYSRMGDRDSAHFDYKKAAELDPNDIESLEAATSLCCCDNYNCGYESARFRISHLKQIREASDKLKRDPRNVEALLERADGYYATKDSKRAIQDCDEALRLDSTNNKILEIRANAYASSGDTAAQIADLTELVRREPGNVERLFDRASAYYWHKDYDYAFQDLNEVLRRNPTNTKVWLWRSDFYKRLGQKKLAEQAMKEYRRLQKEEFKRDKERKREAKAEPKRIAEAKKAPDTTVNVTNTEAKPGQTQPPQITPQPSRTTVALGYLEKGEYDRAIDEYSEAIRLDARNHTNFLGRGRAYYSKGDYDRAIQDYSKALELYPKPLFSRTSSGTAKTDPLGIPFSEEPDVLRSSLVRQRGEAYWMKGDYAQAIQDYEQAVRVTRPGADGFGFRYSALLSRGVVRYFAKDYDLAIQDFTEAIALDDRSAKGYLRRGLAYAGKGQYDRAIQDYTAGLGREKDRDMFLLTLLRGYAYGAAGQTQAASTDFAAALGSTTSAPKYEPSDAEGFYWRGSEFSRQERSKEAVRDLTEAVRRKLPRVLLVFALTSRGYDRFKLGSYSDAAADFGRVVEYSPSDPYPVIWRYLGRMRAQQSESSGLAVFGFMDELARTDSVESIDKTLNRTSKTPAEELNANAASVNLTKWPGQVIQLYSGKMTPKALLAAASHSDAKVDREQHCEAFFYLAEHALLQKNKTEATRLFRQTRDTGVSNFVEYQHAAAELARIASEKQ